MGITDTTYTVDRGELICAEIADGKSLRSVCNMEGMPDKKTVLRWLRSFPEFEKIYTIACAERAEAYAEEIVDIADDGTNDYYKDSHGNLVVDKEHINRSRLRVDTRKWICAKMKPKKYGEKVEATHQAGDSLQALLQAIDGKSRSLPG